MVISAQHVRAGRHLRPGWDPNQLEERVRRACRGTPVAFARAVGKWGNGEMQAVT
jgi:hypothetical protein